MKSQIRSSSTAVTPSTSPRATTTVSRLWAIFGPRSSTQSCWRDWRIWIQITKVWSKLNLKARVAVWTKNHSNSCKYSQRSRKTSTHSICSTNSSRSQPLTFQTSLSSNAFKPLRSSELKRKSKLRKSASCILKRSVKPKASMKMSLPTTESPCTCPLLKLRQRDLRADCTWRPQQST